MEFIAAFLTAFFVWVFAFHWMTGARARAREWAGDLLLELEHPTIRRTRVLLLVLGSLVVLPITAACVLLVAVDGPALVFPWAMTVLVMCLLSQSLLVRWELRERGIVTLSGARAMLVPWARIKYCKWTRATANLFVQCRWSVYSYKVQPDQMESATAVLIRRVRLRDSTGKVLNPEFEPPRDPDDSGEPTGSYAGEAEPFQFQFTLRTLLLLMLLASSAFSWLGIRYQRSTRQTEVLAELQEYRPNVLYRGGYVTDLSFLWSPSRPRDEDLVHLNRLTKLEELDLRHAPVTDAGLVHLQNLTKLERLDLRGTQVTEEGVRRLQQALPDTKILH